MLALSCMSVVPIDFQDGVNDFDVGVNESQEPIKWSLHLPYKPLESTLSRVDL